MHRDDTMRFLSVTKSSNLLFDGDDSGLLSRLQILLLNHSSFGKISSFAQRLLDLMIVHPSYGATKRVCLAKRLGIANQIRAESVGTNADGPNLMPAGYSCFVDSMGSLFHLRASEIRMFDDAEKVTQSFLSRGRPVQRSINYISKMGLKSGLCLALPYHGTTGGFLFLNGADSSILEENPSRYCILSYIQTIATLALIESGMPSDSYYLVAGRDHEAYQGDFLNTDKLASTMHAHFERLGHKAELINFMGKAPNALISHGNIANLITRFAASQGLKRLTLQVSADEQRLRWNLTWDGQSAARISSILINSVIKDFDLFDMTVEINKDHLNFTHAIDKGAPNQAVAYSVQ